MSLVELRSSESPLLLSHSWILRGEVVPGAQRGRELGFPTANLSPTAYGRVPADGVYAGHLSVDGRTYPAAISVGSNPTFEGVPAQQVEAHVIDEMIDLYGAIVEVAFVARIRGMEAFGTIEALIETIRADVDYARALLREQPHSLASNASLASNTVWRLPAAPLLGIVGTHASTHDDDDPRSPRRGRP
jgi:FAD synthase